MTSLILSADDFGYHADIDEAIVELAERGRLSAASCMTSSPRWRDAARTIATVRTSIDVGLHLDFTEFHPLRDWNSLVAAAAFRRLDPRQVREHIVRQLDAFEEALGTPPGYIDGHRHVHQLPVIRTELLRQLRERYAGREPWIRISRPAGGGLKELAIRAMGATALAREAGRAGFACTGRLLGVYDFALSPEAYRRALDGWLAGARPLDALMVHVARASPADDPIGVARTIEYEALRDDWFAQALSRNGIQLIRGPAFGKKSVAPVSI